LSAVSCGFAAGCEAGLRPAVSAPINLGYAHGPGSALYTEFKTR
jgi:hypothetical protein